MARRPMMAANWKMNKTVREAQEYTAALLPRAADADEVDVAVFAPFTCLREVFGEDDDMVARKTKRAVEADILPIVCVGETKEERDAGGMWEKVSGQVGRVVEELEDVGGESVVFAYEPIWAIGTGDTATPEDAQDAISKIRDLLRESKGDDFSGNVRILYGGSVKPENAAEIMAQEDIDGALVGGASLEGESYVEPIRAAQNSVARTEQ